MPDLVPTFADLGSLTSAGPDTFPFRRQLSLRPLIDFWRGDATSGGGTVCSTLGHVVTEALAQAPELAAPITDLTVFDRHADVVDALMAAVFAPAAWDQTLGGALLPFDLVSVYETPGFRRALLDDAGHMRGTLNLGMEHLKLTRLRFAYKVILARVYGINVEIDHPFIVSAPDLETGLTRHYRITFDATFLDARVDGGEAPVLTIADRMRLDAAFFDVAPLMQLLPPDRFLLEGFTIVRAIDVTDQEVLSSIKRDLIDRESVVSSAKFEALQTKLRTLFRRADLRFGLAALDGGKVFILNYAAAHEHACIFADSKHHEMKDFDGTVYARAVEGGCPVIVHDLAEHPDPHPVEQQMVDAGIRAVLVAPLHYQDRVIGEIELGATEPGAFTPMHLPKLAEILPLFAMAVQRSIDELNNRVQAVIKEKATAIHPTVEWRFRQAVLDSIERRREGADGQPEMDAIVFPDVYPLYALADIRGSSMQRALAIQADLVAQLRLAGVVIDEAHRAKALPALDELRYRLTRHVTNIEKGLKSGDEVGVIAFLRNDVEGLFGHLESFGPRVRERIAAYQDALDPRLHAVYHERRKFEESVTRLAEGISSYLDLEEQGAQAMFPHYFEKQKTDGVDYQIYVGASLVEHGGWDPLYLKNLRLWQLMVSCGIAMRSAQIRDKLPVPLETTHLILVQHAPLAIRFRFDEKRFDVDGAYDIRYEIVKKRIDKALVKGSTERATQPGRLVIVYSQPSEAQEYRGYLEYLQSLGYLAGAIENIELEELQGVRGLRALRVTVDTKRARTDATPATALLEGALRR